MINKIVILYFFLYFRLIQFAFMVQPHYARIYIYILACRIFYFREENLLKRRKSIKNKKFNVQKKLLMEILSTTCHSLFDYRPLVIARFQKKLVISLFVARFLFKLSFLFK